MNRSTVTIAKSTSQNKIVKIGGVPPSLLLPYMELASKSNLLVLLVLAAPNAIGFYHRRRKRKEFLSSQDCFNSTTGSFEESNDLTFMSTPTTASYAKPFRCPYCGKEFTKKASLKIHITVHTGEMKFTCKTCSKRFRYSIQLTRHNRMYKH